MQSLMSGVGQHTAVLPLQSASVAQAAVCSARHAVTSLAAQTFPPLVLQQASPLAKVQSASLSQDPYGFS